MAMIMPLFEQASQLEDGKKVGDAKIDAVLKKWVEPSSM
jgi:hypothetical protein